MHKCTLCNDRIHNGLGTACAKACPTGSISFGEVSELKKPKLMPAWPSYKALGHTEANIYGYNEAGGLNVFYLFMDKPSVYGQPEHPVVPQRRLFRSAAITAFTAVAVAVAALISFRERGSKKNEGVKP